MAKWRPTRHKQPQQLTGLTVLLETARFTKTQNGRKQDKRWPPLTRVRPLLKIHKLTGQQQRLTSFSQQRLTLLPFSSSSSSTIPGTSKPSSIILGTHTPTTITTPWVLMAPHTHQISMVYHQRLTQELQPLMGSLLLFRGWRTRPPATPLNPSLLPLPTPSLPRAQPPQRTPLLPHPHLFLPHPTPSIPIPHHRILTIPVTPCPTLLVTPTKCKFTIIPREGLTMVRASSPRTLISPLRIHLSSNSSQASMCKDLAEERPTKTKTINKDNNCGTV